MILTVTILFSISDHNSVAFKAGLFHILKNSEKYSLLVLVYKNANFLR